MHIYIVLLFLKNNAAHPSLLYLFIINILFCLYTNDLFLSKNMSCENFPWETCNLSLFLGERINSQNSISNFYLLLGENRNFKF
jgi:hypothetical protein